jgi:hypothetical protein
MARMNIPPWDDLVNGANLLLHSVLQVADNIPAHTDKIKSASAAVPPPLALPSPVTKRDAPMDAKRDGGGKTISKKPLR